MIYFYAIIVAFIIPLGCAAYAKLSQKGYDNRSPREFLNKLQGKGQRANFAQQNSHEAFAPFAIGVLVAHILGGSNATINLLAYGFIFARIAYCYCYIEDFHVLRSIVWTIGMACTITLYFVGM